MWCPLCGNSSETRTMVCLSGQSGKRATTPAQDRYFKLLYTKGIVCIPLTVNHEIDRLACCRKLLFWAVDNWRRVLLSDESRFTVWTVTRDVFSSGENPGIDISPLTLSKRTTMV
ncbi:hypothetical protein TNCV_3754051 [Trichonephila clavipes]|nr:hypothetical protein TNCV_3754051 [Trichonephila clavipes]